MSQGFNLNDYVTVDERIQLRFWAKVDKAEACWIWTGGRTTGGYGSFSLGKNQNRYAHRLAYEWLVGPIPLGLELDHLCRVTFCCNPVHLELVTHAENIRRGWEHKAHPVACPQGHPYSEENSYVWRGITRCRICIRRRRAERWREWQA